MVGVLIKISGIEMTLFVIGIGVFYLMAALEKPSLPGDGVEIYCRNLTLCRTWSLLTALLAWAAALFGTREGYLAGCQALGEHCADAGETWMAAALVFLVLHAVLALAKRGGRYRERMLKMTVSAMTGGMIFSVMAVLLIGG